MFFCSPERKPRRQTGRRHGVGLCQGTQLGLHNFTNYLSAGFSFTADLKGSSFLCEAAAALIVRNILSSKRNSNSNRATRCFVLGQFSALNLRPLEAN